MAIWRLSEAQGRLATLLFYFEELYELNGVNICQWIILNLSKTEESC